MSLECYMPDIARAQAVDWYDYCMYLVNSMEACNIDTYKLSTIRKYLNAAHDLKMPTKVNREDYDDAAYHTYCVAAYRIYDHIVDATHLSNTGWSKGPRNDPEREKAWEIDTKLSQAIHDSLGDWCDLKIESDEIRDKWEKRGVSLPQFLCYESLIQSFPTARLEHEIVCTNGMKRYADIAILEAKMDIEYDGAFWHRSPTFRQRDKERDKLLAKNGWATIRISKSKSRQSDFDQYIKSEITKALKEMQC